MINQQQTVRKENNFNLLSLFKFSIGSRRANRARYIRSFCLCIIIVPELASFFGGLVRGLEISPTSKELFLMFCPLIIIISLINLFFVQINRLHDLNFSAWWILLANILAPISWLYLFTKRGTKGDNRFGSPDKEATLFDYMQILVAIFLIIWTYWARSNLER